MGMTTNPAPSAASPPNSCSRVDAMHQNGSIGPIKGPNVWEEKEGRKLGGIP
jgi:hypothetical protein